MASSKRKSSNSTAAIIVSLYLLATLLLGGTYFLYETKPLPTTYAYEEALQKATQVPHIAKLTISPTIRYGGTGHNSLRKITHTIQLLSQSTTNKGLVISLLPPPQKTLIQEIKEAFQEPDIDTDGFVSYRILQDSLQAYKKHTNRNIIVYTRPTLLHVSFLFILAIADEIILDNTSNEDDCECPEYLKEDNSAHKDYFGQTEQPKNILYAGKYQLREDPKEVKHIANGFKDAINKAVIALQQQIDTRAPTPNMPVGTTSDDVGADDAVDVVDTEEPIQVLDIHHTSWDEWLDSFNSYLQAYSAFMSPDEVDSFIKEEMAQEAIIDLTPCISKHSTPAYAPKKRNSHRRTDACFETIIISGDIDSTLGEKISPLIRSAHCDPNIKGVIIVWDNDGGEFPSTKALLHLLKKLDATKPIVHVATDVCRWGAYLLATGTGKQLIAYPNSVLGEIGICDILKKSPTNVERAKITKELEEDRQWMTQVIAQHRAPILRENIKKYRQKLHATEARVYTASRALEEQLIDKIGTLQDAIEALKKYTGLDLPVYYSAPEPALRDLF